ncbi:MAG TPA: hypothetical protein VGP66_03585 [Candidatus Acidoferrum sp.]|jgi:hypothetical protein|nr:hypothetical protein [Candidatus Acidoferrum sp.]
MRTEAGVTGELPSEALPRVEEVSPSNIQAKTELGLVLLVSAAILIPCFWQRHIQAGDLASHVYNAWLAQLIGQGKASGVYAVWQAKNVLFDLMLLKLGNIFGFGAAEKLAVSLCVVVFFWGVFTLISVATRKRPWLLVPGLAMLTYGYVFYMGFMNYYLSLGLACFGLAALWHGERRGILMAVVLAPLTLLAHPLGFLWLVAAGAYRLLWPLMRGWAEWFPPAAAIGIGLLVRWVLARHPEFQPDWPDKPFFQWNGVDQFWVFRSATRNVALAMIVFMVVATLLDLLPWRRGSANGKERRLFPEFYVVAFCLTSLLPENLRPDENAGWIGLLVTRLTLISAVFLFCWLGTLRPRKWHFFVLATCAAVYFTFVYRDTRLANQMEESAERITRELPPGTRVIATIFEPRDYRMVTLHVVDRACVGHCFLYSNYEAATKQFRLRVREGSPVAVASTDDSEDMQFGSYEVQDEDLPLKEIYQCDAKDWTKLCIRDLRAGEKNGEGEIRPE